VWSPQCIYVPRALNSENKQKKIIFFKLQTAHASVKLEISIQDNVTTLYEQNEATGFNLLSQYIISPHNVIARVSSPSRVAEHTILLICNFVSCAIGPSLPFADPQLKLNCLIS
jgi:hypothetical protein